MGPISRFFKFRRPVGTIRRNHQTIRTRLSFEDLENRITPTISNINVIGINPAEGTPFGTPGAPQLVAQFTVDNYLGTDASNQYSSTIHWGDGDISSGLGGLTISFQNPVGNGGAVYRVSSYHTYSDASPVANPYSLAVDIFDSSNQGTTQSSSNLITVSDLPLTQSALPAINAVVGSPLTNVDVADFTDANPLSDAGDFTATIQWGNPSQSTSGTVIRDFGGVYHVLGSHTYDASASPTSAITVTVRHVTQTVTMNTSATVTQAAVVPTAVPVTILDGATTIAAGTSVGWFADAGGARPVGNYTATVQFPGSLTPTALTVVQIGTTNSYTLTTAAATNLIVPAEVGVSNYTLTVTPLNGAATSASGSLIVNDAALTLVSTANNLAPVEGARLSNVSLLAFTDANATGAVGDFAASIDWGDGSPSSEGTLSQAGGAGTPFTASGSHIYYEETATGVTYQVTVRVKDKGGSQVSGQTSAFSVSDAALVNPVAIPVTGASGQGLSVVPVGLFTDNNPYATANDFTATINWGDGSPTSTGFATLVGGNSTSAVFSISGNHVYASAGTFTVFISVVDTGNVDGGGLNFATTATIAATPLSGAVNPVVATEGIATANNLVVATFYDAAATGTTTLNVSLDWGDGTAPSTTGGGDLSVVATGGGNYIVRATPHTYADAGSYVVTATILDSVGSGPISPANLAIVRDAALTATSGGPFTVVEGALLTAANANPLITFIDANPAGVIADFTATINWGDGTSGTGTITQPGGPNTAFNVLGSHTYTANGSYTITVSVVDADGSKATATAGVTATPTALTAGPAITINGNQDTPTGTVEVATFTSGNSFDTASLYAATITWGDGTAPSAGSIVRDAGGVFHVSGVHTYSTAGSFNATVLVSGGGGASINVNATAVIAAAPISGSVPPVVAIEGIATANNLVIATFTDTGASGTTTFTVSVDWGDGTAPSTLAGGTLTVVATGGGNYVVRATPHTYANVGSYVVTATIRDSDGAGPISPANLATVADAALTATNGGPFTVVEGAVLNATNGTPFITFLDANPTGGIADFTASINWGDGTTGTGTISQPGGPNTIFNAIGSHIFKKPGTYTVTVSIQDKDGSHTSATATVTATMAAHTAGPVSNFNGVQNTPIVNVGVTTFTSGNPFDTASLYVATINWGDGTTATAGSISQDAAGTFHVIGTHTYTSAGTFNPSVVIAEGDPVVVLTINNTGTATISSTPILVSSVDIHGIEGVALPNAQNAINGTVVATFVDLGTAGPLSAYTAQIIWGNSQTTAGTILQDGPNFTVIAPMNPLIVYPDTGNFTARVTVTKQTSGGPGFFQAFAIDSVIISDAALTAVAPQPVVNGFQQTPMLAVPVARFLDGNPTAPLSDFSATIDWGDGSPQSAGTITQPGGVGTAFTVVGNHTYANPTTVQPYAITVNISDVDGASLRTTTTANIQASTITGTPVTINGVEGQVLSGVVVAYFHDTGIAGPLSSYSATINWGTGLAGSTTIGQIVQLGGNDFQVQGTYTYPSANVTPGNPYSVTVSINHNGALATVVTSQANIADAPISGVAVPIFAVEGAAYAGTVGFFTSANPADTAAKFSATITWGDGFTTAGKIVPNGSSFLVTGADPISGLGHAYREEGTFAYSITVTSVDGSTLTAFQIATVQDAPLTSTGLTLGVAPTIFEWPAFSGIVANFTDANPFEFGTSQHIATIYWGDGVTSTGTIAQLATAPGAPTKFTVSGNHLYNPGFYQVTIVVRDLGGSTTTTLTSITIADSLLTAGAPIALTVVEGKPFTAQVATFTDANALGTIGEFSATIAWGDGTNSSAIIGQNAAGVFTVTGTHTYTTFTPAGTPNSVVVSIRSINGATANVTSTATVTDAPLTSVGTTITGIEGNSTGNVLIATFTDSNPFSLLTDFTTGGGVVTVDWGDGSALFTASAASISSVGSPSGVTYSVRTTHTYAETGTYQIVTTIRDNGGAATIASSVANIADAALTRAAVQPTIAGTEGQTFTGTVFTFLDGNPLAPISDFSAEINWGDGRIDAGTITQPGGVGTPFNVVGSHLFPDSGVFTLGVTVFDHDGSTVAYSTSVTIVNVPPTATISNTGPVNENSPVTVSLSNPLDPSPADTLAGFRYSFATLPAGLAGSYIAALPSSSAPFTFPDGLVPAVGTTVYGRIFDKDGGFTDYQTIVTVNNVAPTATLGVVGTLIPGQPVNVTFTNPFDPSPVDTTAGFRYSFDLGTGVFGAIGNSPTAVFTPPGPGTYVIRGRIYDKDGSFTEYVASAPPGNPGLNVVVPNVDQFAIGAGATGGPIVHVFSASDNRNVANFTAYEPSFRGGVLVAVGDVTGDGIPDIVTGTGNGGGPVVKIFDGKTYAEIASFLAYENSFRGGVLVAVGDVDGDGRAEIITGTGVGGGPVVKVWNASTLALVSSFAAYDISARGGVFVAAANVLGDARKEIITGAGAGGGPHVKVFNASGGMLQSFFANDPSFTGGVTVSGGDLYGSGHANIVTGTGPGGDANLRIFHPSSSGLILSEFVFGADKITGQPLRNGFTVSASHVGGPNGRPIILAGAGPDYGPTVRVLDAVTLDFIAEILPFEDGFSGGAYVG